MAIDTNTKFNTGETEMSKGMTSIKSARVQRDKDIDSFRRGNEESLYLKALDEQVKKLEEINNRTAKQNELLSEAKRLQLQMNEYTDISNQQYEEFLKKNKDVLNIAQKINKEVYSTNYKKNIDNEEEINRLIRERTYDLENYDNLLDSINKKLETSKEANKSMLEAFSDNLDSLQSKVKDLAIIKGIGDISQGLFGNGNSSMMSAYTSTRAQLGVTTSEFNNFKNGLFNQLKENGSLFEFGWKDTADYMARLGELNITSQEMAEEQYLAVIQGTKYLGLQTETQAKILKISRDTGRSDLLQSTNETIVQIMNAQLGVSKEQLNTMVNQAASIADMSVFLGGSGDALEQLTKVQAAVTKEYGSAASNAATNILSEIMNNPADNKYLTSGFLGGNYNDIVGYIQNDDFVNAFKTIIDSVQSSQSAKVASNNIYAANALGADSNIMALYNASGSMSNVDTNLSNIESASSDIADAIKDFNKSWSDKIVNAGSNILSLLPFSEFINLQNAYYAIAIVTVLTKIPLYIKQSIALLNQIAKSTAIGAKGLDLPEGGLRGLLSTSLSPLQVIAAGVTSIAMFIGDAKSGYDKSEEWGTGKVSSTIGGLIGGTDDNALARTLKNAGKYALAGAAIGSFFPGIGNVAGWVIGGLIGLIAGGVTGGIGGQNIANGLDSVFGKRKDLDEGGVGAAPSMPSPHYSTGGKGAASQSYPWPITSYFGNRTLSNGDSSFHNGVDWGIATGTPIGAPVSGTIVSTKVDNRNTYPNGPTSAGSGVYLQGDNGVKYQFWHLSSVGVKTGQRVNAGEAIGLSGNTGYSTGPHLHFGAQVSGNWQNPLSYVTSGLFEANGDSYHSETDGMVPGLESESKEGEKLLQSVISADTISKQAGAYGMGAGNDDVVYAVNTGFTNLNAKLDELSSRQDNQEAVLRELTSSKKSNIMSY